MTLSEFNPRLLNFLYELTKLDSYKSSAEIAKAIKLEGGRRITPKTVRNWFRYLRKPYSYLDYKIERKLSYFPCTFKNKLGLSMVNVFFENPSEELIKLFPLKNYVGQLYDPVLNKPVLVVEYVVPKENLSDFRNIIHLLKEKGLCTSFSFYETGPSFRITSPFHKVLDKSGMFHFDRNDPSVIDVQMNSLARFMELDFEVEMIQAIRRNPLIVPVLAEYIYEQRSSVQVWNAIKFKLGNSVWDYFKHSRKKSDGVGLKMIQSVVNNLGFFGLLNQMRVVYFPMDMGINFAIYVVFRYKNEEEFLKKIRSVALNSIYVNVFPLHGKRVFFVSLLNSEAIQRLFAMFSSSEIEKFLLFDHLKSITLMTTKTYSTFDYSQIFDPCSCRWKYSQEELSAELDNLP